ncbi:hypothetical protein [Vibrio vulnificus YJ016]|uniref:Uncharacterized protein n=1 Tax=Vibrio vulnificus (strain YJ016) TaxID=196600 RepID=Q7MMB1_VIBVY|nr:hypothetical protein [Vibrio vulnificus YJ016]
MICLRFEERQDVKASSVVLPTNTVITPKKKIKVANQFYWFATILLLAKANASHFSKRRF